MLSEFIKFDRIFVQIYPYGAWPDILPDRILNMMPGWTQDRYTMLCLPCIPYHCVFSINLNKEDPNPTKKMIFAPGK